ncbi:transcriptional regulator [Actinoplanes philippinensis]|uniref:Sugar kinase of the NBD/HSP70 family, may contain an N-terminal HTH domain n=1 Tax=Actinoplanes philippinensis TaxID=35752 RepID=A0A1I2KA15_9ACTN|nr:ROK family transcriptional regulator [Actinoplanes philippinensis]GIE81498.1 transcriptional regulator [Actinoplanes philippinensis]SFF61981.1 Sugar kinase of the NBD/HSP70 family, may contain an N-terminal HTH domain [Actinoplanes philippinensis]
MRAHNLALVLHTVANSTDPPSRAAVATATGLTRATVSALVDDLVAGGLLVEVDPPPRTGAGRPAVGLTLTSAGPAGLGLEINVDYLAACVVDLTGAVRHRHVERADQRPADPAQALAALGRLAATARHAAEADGLIVAGAALAVPGLVAGGVVRVAPNLGWQDVDAVAALRAVPELAGLPITVDNEANLAALGELRVTGGPPPTGTAAPTAQAIAAAAPGVTAPAGAAPDPAAAAAGDLPIPGHPWDRRSFLYISGEIGIGAGLVIDGELYRGVRGWSGEIGHVTVYPDGRPCRCGARGCLEQYAGQEALARDEQLAAAALGIALSAVVNLLDVPVIVLGGAYAPIFGSLRDGIEAELRRRVLTAGLAPVTLRPAALGPDAAMRGAADTIIRAVREDPAAWLRRLS